MKFVQKIICALMKITHAQIAAMAVGLVKMAFLAGMVINILKKLVVQVIVQRIVCALMKITHAQNVAMAMGVVKTVLLVGAEYIHKQGVVKIKMKLRSLGHYQM